MTAALRENGVLRTWFGVEPRVDAGTYAVSGVVLMALKYGVEAAVFWAVTASIFAPWDFANPLLSAREAILRPAPLWLTFTLYLWTLPFLWIAVSMSIRRAADAGLSPWTGFLVLVPIINLAVMLVLCVLPSGQRESWGVAGKIEGERPLLATMSVGASLLVGGGMILVSVYWLSLYGASLFLGTPLMMGAVAAYLYNRGHSHSFLTAAGLGAAAAVLGCAAMLLFALEGLICLIMAAPMAVPIAALGGILGKAIADATRRPAQELTAIVLVLPLWAAGEAWLARAADRVVLTSIEIDATPERVWQHVVSFPDLPAERAWYFRLGIACPERARIVGQGVGATRYCEFTTGAFVEPITVWDEPRRLAFDVAEQPMPMFELSPYPHVHPPHLSGFMRSTRGEFRLIGLKGGGTRLEGRTWYRNEMFPQWYWSGWSDLLIHKIHERVLEHIEELAEETTPRVGTRK
jgi:uncharacterized membrane protein YhaH (DUF805 family)